MTNQIAAGTSASKLFIVIQMLFALALFMLSIDLLTVSMTQINSDFSERLFQATNNPFVGLFIGLLITALIQSSSTVTAMTVAVVASGNLTLVQAVPLVMGANIGTTLTSTLFAFSYILKKSEFKKAMAAGVIHYVFNILSVVILFPLEVYFGFLSHLSTLLANSLFFTSGDVTEGYTYNVMFTRPLAIWVNSLIEIPLVSLISSILLLFLAIKFLSATVFKTFVSTNFNHVSKHIFKDPYIALVYGFFLTAAVQSSTVTTCLMVPAVASRKVSLAKAFPFIIGANIGTTVTAGIAALFKTEAAIGIAIVHFLFNMIGAVIFLPFPAIRTIPVKIATFLARESVRNRIVGLAYILLTFFIIPFLLIYFNKEGNI